MSKEKERGEPQSYEINGEKITVNPEFTGKKTARKYRRQARQKLEKINAADITVTSGGYHDDSYAEATWRMNDTDFEFRCEVFDTQKANMGAISLYLRDWWRHVKRGINDPIRSLKQFEALPSQTEINNEYAGKSLSELRELQKKYHPDTGEDGGDVKEFQKVREAVEDKKGHMEVSE